MKEISPPKPSETKQLSGDNILDAKRVNSESATAEQARRMDTAREFIRTHIRPSRDGSSANAKTEKLMRGIDFRHDVRVETVQPGTIVCQFKRQADQNGVRPKGAWFTMPGADRRTIGTLDGRRGEPDRPDFFIITRPTAVLRCTAADIAHGDRSINSAGLLVHGGAEQLFVGERPRLDKGAFRRIVESRRINPGSN